MVRGLIGIERLNNGAGTLFLVSSKRTQIDDVERPIAIIRREIMFDRVTEHNSHKDNLRGMLKNIQVVLLLSFGLRYY